MAIVTKLHPTLKVQRSLKRNTQRSYNMRYKGYFFLLKKKILPLWRNPNLSIVPLLGGAAQSYLVNMIMIMAYNETQFDEQLI